MTTLMNSFPASNDAQVTLANWRNGPFNKWAFHHVREIVPSANIATRNPSSFEQASVDLSGIDFGTYTAEHDVDGLVILHRGKIIHETYTGTMTALDPHILMSISKSMLGLLCGILSDAGILDVAAPVTDYVPELEATAFKGATVRHLLDMRAGLHFDEDYLATSGPIIEYRKATNWNPLEDGEAASDLRSFFATLTESKGPHGGAFDYMSPCTDLLGWVIERATGQAYAQVFSERLWQPLGAEEAAYITVDRLGAPRCAGGVCMTSRDLARIGQMLVDNGAGIVPEAWVDDLETGGDPEAWDNGSFAPDMPGIAMHYRSKWYCLREDGPILMGLGIHGQNLLVDRQAGLVLARHSSCAAPLDLSGDLASVALFKAIRERVS